MYVGPYKYIELSEDWLAFAVRGESCQAGLAKVFGAYKS